MCHLLIAKAQEGTISIQGGNVLELGAGVGILGIVAVALGAQNVAITEINDLCRVAIAINVMINGDVLPGLQSKVHIAPLKYGTPDVDKYIKGIGALNQGPGPLPTYSLILGTDVVYSDELIGVASLSTLNLDPNPALI